MNESEALANFLAICPDAGEDYALMILKNHNMDVERAVEFFFEAGPSAVLGGSNNNNDDDADGAKAAREAQLAADAALAAELAASHASVNNNNNNNDDDNNNNNNNMGGAGGLGGGDEFVRAPIAPTRGVLVEEGLAMGLNRRSNEPQVDEVFRDFARATRDAAGAAEVVSAPGRNLEELFRPPHELIFRGGFMEAKDRAVQDKRWLLVNVQKRDEFDSQRLNRDTWSNDAVKSIVQTFCIFWQIQHSLEEASRFLNYYSITEFELPCILLIDPRTGEKMRAWHRFVEPEVLADQLSAIIDRYSLESFSAPPPAQPHHKRQRDEVQPSASADIMDESEDAQLAAAIAASMDSASQQGALVQPADPAPTEQVPSEPVQPTEPKRTALPTETENKAQQPGAEATLRIRLPSGDAVMVKFSENDTVETVHAYMADFLPGNAKFTLVQPMPRKVFDSCDFHTTLKEADLFPRANLNVTLL